MSLTGAPVIYGIKPHEVGSDQKHTLGTLGVTNDGRKYRYAQNAGSSVLSPGLLCVAPDITTNHEDRAVNTFAIGDTTLTVSIGGTGIIGDEYDEGFINITDDNGQGIMYKIKRIDRSSAGSEDITVDLAEPITVAAETNTTVTLYRNKYRDIVISDGTQADLAVGVPNVSVPVDEFAWVQTGGPCSILNDTSITVVAGQPVVIADASSGAVEVSGAATDVVVGVCPAGAVADTDEYQVIELTLD